MVCVDDKWSHAIPSMAKNMEHLQERLVADHQYSIGPDLDRHIDAVIQNSRAVASVSSDEYKNAILKDCEDVRNKKSKL